MPKTREQDHRPAGLRAYATTYDGGPAGTDRVMTVNVKPPESRLSKVLALVGWNRERTAPARWMPSDDVDELLAFSEEDAMRIRIRTRARVTLPGAVQTKHRLHGPYRVVTGFLASGGQPEVLARTREAQRETGMMIFGSVGTGRTRTLPNPRTET